VSGASWRDWYYGDAQSLWALVALPALWLIWRLLRGRPKGSGAEPAAADFVDRWALVFSVVALLDPLFTGPVSRAVGSPFAVAFLVAFVLLGDFRVFLLVCYLAGGRRSLRRALREAALLTPVVGAFAFSVYRIAGAAAGSVHGQLLWLVYELGFLGMLFFVRREVITARAPVPPSPRETWLGRVTAFVAVYYGLWVACDLLILAGVDAGWALRALPNQLYYGLLVPFVHGSFFASSYVRTRTSSQAAR
jgi:hypothetical protein